MQPMKYPMILAILCGLSLYLISGCGSSPSQPSNDNAAVSTAPTQQNAVPSDSEIISAVKSALQRDSDLATATITVTAENGVVTLAGRVNNPQSYNRAISIARSALGGRLRVLATGLSY